MADEKPSRPTVDVPGYDKPLSVKRARVVMEELTEEAASLREDESSAAKARRVDIARALRAIQKKIDDLEEVVEVIVPPNDPRRPWCPNFPLHIGPKDFWPGTYRVRSSVAQTLRYMMDQVRETESQRLVSGGNVDPNLSGIASLGRELPAI